jgi:PelA/Pel-15E family pectate lyase
MVLQLFVRQGGTLFLGLVWCSSLLLLWKTSLVVLAVGENDVTISFPEEEYYSTAALWEDVCESVGFDQENETLKAGSCETVSNSNGPSSEVKAEEEPYHQLEWFRSAGDSLTQKSEFYGTQEAARVAETILAYQNANTGGWPKDYDKITERTKEELDAIRDNDSSETTFDNDATHTEIRFLARVHQQQPDTRYESAMIKGLEFILRAQYEKNGGWPQRFPLRQQHYSSHVTFNDGAMTGILQVLYEALLQETELYDFLPSILQVKIELAFERGLELVLNLQLWGVDGKPAAWCAQYNAETLLPAQGRSYEPPSISGRESVGILQFLMSIEHPSRRVQSTIVSAMDWFQWAQIRDLGYECVKTVVVDETTSSSSTSTFTIALNQTIELERRVFEDPGAGPLWARFYDWKEETSSSSSSSNRPIFQDRNGIIYSDYMDVSYERRMGYDYFTAKPLDLFCGDFPQWRQRQQQQQQQPPPLQEDIAKNEESGGENDSGGGDVDDDHREGMGSTTNTILASFDAGGLSRSRWTSFTTCFLLSIFLLPIRF